MLYRFETVVRDLKALLSECEDATSFLQPDERWVGLEADPQVRLLFPYFATQRLLAADPATLDTISTITEPTVADGPDSGSVGLPADFLRLAAFRMPDWPRSVTFPADSSSLLAYASGRSVLLRRMITPLHPAVLIEREGFGLRLRYFGTAVPSAPPLVAEYLPRPCWSPEDTIELDPIVYREALCDLAKQMDT